MTTMQAFCLGVMVALTPSLIVFACLLWRAPTFESDDNAG